jgi:hypothetical protein
MNNDLLILTRLLASSVERITTFPEHLPKPDNQNQISRTHP